MKSTEFITEGRDASLYHGLATMKSVEFVFKNDIIAPTENLVHTVHGEKYAGISLSRNKHMAYGYVVLELDQVKLAQRYKIKPIDQNPTKAYNKGERDRNNKTHWGHKKGLGHYLQEEVLIGTIKPLHNYLTGIKITEPTHGDWFINDNNDELLSLVYLVKEYAEQWHIQLDTKWIDKELQGKSRALSLECPACDGNGFIDVPGTVGTDDYQTKYCPTCGGDGQVYKEVE